MIELKFLKILMLIRQMHLKNVSFVTIGIFWIHGYYAQSSVCDGCYNILMIFFGTILPF